jgi:hypothetical protein
MTRMRISLLTAVAALFGMAVAGGAQADTCCRGLVLINHAHAPVSAFYVSAAGGNMGVTNLLEGANLRQNHYVELNLNDATGYCRFDFKTVYADGTSEIRRNVDACTFNKYELNH